MKIAAKLSEDQLSYAGYVAADDVRDEAFAVIRAAIRNTTGVSSPI